MKYPYDHQPYTIIKRIDGFKWFGLKFKFERSKCWNFTANIQHKNITYSKII